MNTRQHIAFAAAVAAMLLIAIGGLLAGGGQ